MTRNMLPILAGVSVLLGSTVGCSKASDTTTSTSATATSTSPTATTSTEGPPVAATASKATAAHKRALSLSHPKTTAKSWQIGPNGKKLVFTVLPDGLQIADLKVGTGASPKVGQTILVQYTGTLLNGQKFDSSYDHGGKPIGFPIGVGQVIRGWDEGALTMKVGGKRRLYIPSALAYGPQEQPGIPADSDLIFDIELVGIQ